ncbi:MAG: hypothetical protein FWF85_03000 [Clostridiales bacterium]|nr:hypothetical protein [Clostridiales bacterium]
MNITVFASSGNVFVNCEYIKGFSFKNTAIGDKSALLPVICAAFGLLQNNYAYFSRIECLLPQSHAA